MLRSTAKAGPSLFRKLACVFGSVNANRRHYQHAEEALRRADKHWLGRLIARREPIEHWRSAIERQPNDVKTVLCFPAL